MQIKENIFNIWQTVLLWTDVIASLKNSFVKTVEKLKTHFFILKNHVSPLFRKTPAGFHTFDKHSITLLIFIALTFFSVRLMCLHLPWYCPASHNTLLWNKF